MRFWKTVDSGFFHAIGTGNGGEEITEAEYDTILEVIRNKPQQTGTTDYRLRENLTWEAYEVEPPDEDPDIDEAEAFDIIFGGAV